MNSAKIITFVIIIALISGFFNSPAAAIEDDISAPKKKLNADAELSFIDTSGNTQVTSLSAKNTFTYALAEKLSYKWSLLARYAENDDIRSAEDYATEMRLDYHFTDRFYTAGLAGWKKDVFAGIENRYYGGPSAGYFLIKEKHHELKIESGLDYVNEEYSNGDEYDFMQGRSYGVYEWAFTRKSKLNQEVEYLIDLSETDNYKLNSLSALTIAINSMLSLKLSYEINYTNRPVPDTILQTDTLLGVTLVINYL